MHSHCDESQLVSSKYSLAPFLSIFLILFLFCFQNIILHPHPHHVQYTRKLPHRFLSIQITTICHSSNPSAKTVQLQPRGNQTIQTNIKMYDKSHVYIVGALHTYAALQSWNYSKDKFSVASHFHDHFPYDHRMCVCAVLP